MVCCTSGRTPTTFYAFNAETGQLLWTGVGGCGASSPAVADGVVYCGSNGLYAYDAATGEPLWTAAPGFIIVAPPTVANRVVYAADVNSRISIAKRRGESAATTERSINTF